MAQDTLKKDFIKDLEKVNWRINIVISSRDLSRVLEPVVQLELINKDETSNVLELSMAKFQSLRHDIALLLREIDLINRKGTNIMRIMAEQ